MKIMKKKIFKWIIGFIFYGAIVLTFAFSVANMKIKHENDIAHLMGIGLVSSSYSTESVNMTDNGQSQKDLLVVHVLEQNEKSSLNHGDVITYFDMQEHAFMTGEIKEIIKNDDKTYYLTDSMVEKDLIQPIESSEVLTVKLGQINRIGGLLEYLQTPKGFAIGILLPVILLWIVESIIIVNVMLASHRQKLLKKFDMIALEKAEEVETEFQLIRKQLLKDFNIE